MALARQEFDDLGGGLAVVGGQGGEIVEVQVLGRVGQQHAGDGDGLEPGPEKLQVPAQEENAQRLALPAELEGVAHLVGVLVQVVDHGVPPAVPEEGLDLLHQVGEEHVLRALHQDGDSGPGLLFQVLGVVVGLEALGLHHRQDLPPGLVADVGMVVEHPGHGSHTAPGQPGDVLDGHSASLLEWFSTGGRMVPLSYFSPLRRRPQPP